MNKFLPLLFIILGLASMTQARNLKGAPQCDLTFYGPTPPPVCNTYIDENGQSQLECSQVGPAASRTTVDKANTTFKAARDSLYEVDFYGNCKCTVTLYTKANYKGTSYSYPFSKANGDAIFANKIWNKSNASYKITCSF